MLIGKHNVRAFVVTLQELPQKTQFIQNHFREMGLQAENFNGVNANISGLKTEHCYDLDNPGSNWNIGAKPVATWMSFYMLWSAMLYMPESHFLTLEWDAKFHPDWKARTIRALDDVPKDFDLLLLGSCCTKNPRKQHVNGEVWQVQWPMCGHATVVAKKAIPVLLETQRKVYAPLDISLALHTFPKLKVYTVLPRVADQFDTFLEE